MRTYSDIHEPDGQRQTVDGELDAQKTHGGATEGRPQALTDPWLHEPTALPWESQGL